MILRILILFLIAVPAFANDAPSDAPPATASAETTAPKQKIDPRAQKAEDYMNALKTVRARFVQTTHDGTQLVGTFYLNRPGKLRFEYDDPIEDFVVADGFFIYFYDSELGEQTNAPIGQTLADFLLRDPITLSGELKVQNIQEAGDMTLIELVQAIDPAAGSITLGMTNEPYTLKKWRIVDGQGLITEVELFYFEDGLDLPDNLFVYTDPDTTKTFNE